MRIKNITGRNRMRMSFIFALFCLLSISLFAQERPSILQDLDRRIGGGENTTSQVNFPKRDKPPYPISNLPAKLKESIVVKDSEKQDYSSRVKKTKGGIAKLWNNLCKNVQPVVDVVEDKECLETSENNKGSVYFFEAQDHLFTMASIGMVNKFFSVAKPRNRNQILVDLGEIDLEKVDKGNDGVKTLLQIDDWAFAKQTALTQILNGVELQFQIPAKLNHTYLLRSFYYDIYNLKPQTKITIYAFQLVRFENNIATILWKKINSKWA